MVFEHDKLVVTLGLYQATGKYPKLSIVSTIFLCIMHDHYDDTRKFFLKSFTAFAVKNSKVNDRLAVYNNI